MSDNDLSVENQNSTLAITGGDDSNRFYLEAADEPNAWFLHVVDLDFDNTQPNPRVINIMVTNEGVTLTGLCHNVCPLETLVAMTTVTVTVNVSGHNCHTPQLACTRSHWLCLLYLSLVHTHIKYAHIHTYIHTYIHIDAYSLHLYFHVQCKSTLYVCVLFIFIFNAHTDS